MSRKELVLKLVTELEKWGNEGSSVYHARHLAPFIERLLADEREKVRDRCIEVCDQHLSVLASSDVRRTILSKLCQLDLTKDLAASSRE